MVLLTWGLKAAVLLEYAKNTRVSLDSAFPAALDLWIIMDLWIKTDLTKYC